MLVTKADGGNSIRQNRHYCDTLVYTVNIRFIYMKISGNILPIVNHLGASDGEAAEVEDILVVVAADDDDDDDDDNAAEDAATDAAEAGCGRATAAEEPGRDGGSGVLHHRTSARSAVSQNI